MKKILRVKMFSVHRPRGRTSFTKRTIRCNINHVIELDFQPRQYIFQIDFSLTDSIKRHSSRNWNAEERTISSQQPV